MPRLRVVGDRTVELIELQIRQPAAVERMVGFVPFVAGAAGGGSGAGGSGSGTGSSTNYLWREILARPTFMRILKDFALTLAGARALPLPARVLPTMRDAAP